MMTPIDERARSFNERYQESEPPPWDIDSPQPIFVDLERRGDVRGRSILDIGCGTGENALYFASRGYDVVGIDFAPKAIEQAQSKAKKRKISATFLAHNALDLNSLSQTFDSVIDSGLFHTLSDEERPIFVESLRSQP